MTTDRCVWIAGATGLVGREALAGLLEDPGFSRVIAFVRRTTGRAHPRLRERIVDFEALVSDPARFANGERVNVAVCCLGTTRKQAGSREQFRRVDFDYALAFARAAQAAGVEHVLVVTALGANARSLAFYNRVKAELEQALAALSLPALTVVRPSLLIGERSERRLGEQLAAPLMSLLPRSTRGIEARTVGRALVRLGREPAHGQRVVLSGELHSLGA